jgi:pimeloyl-ACP methyl ester carboxylesterase
VPLTTNMHKAPFPIEGTSEPGVEVSITPDAFPAIFAPDLPSEIAQVLAVSQRPLAHTAFAEPAGAAAWRTKPCWALVATMDHSINPEVERFGARRANATTIEVEASHAVPLSQPKAVADLIRDAVRATI